MNLECWSNNDSLCCIHDFHHGIHPCLWIKHKSYKMKPCIPRSPFLDSSNSPMHILVSALKIHPSAQASQSRADPPEQEELQEEWHAVQFTKQSILMFMLVISRCQRWWLTCYLPHVMLISIKRISFDESQKYIHLNSHYHWACLISGAMEIITKTICSFQTTRALGQANSPRHSESFKKWFAEQLRHWVWSGPVHPWHASWHSKKKHICYLY